MQSETNLLPPKSSSSSILELTLNLEDLIVKQLEREAASQRLSIERLTAHAVLYYLADLDADRARRSALATQERSRKNASAAVPLGLQEFGYGRLCDEAERQHISPDELAADAVRYYLDDRPSGRLARKVPPL